MDAYILENPHIRVTPVFMKALKNFRIQTGIMLLYSLAKVIATITLSIINSVQNCDSSIIDVWLILVGVQSIIQFWCLLKVKRIMRSLGNIVKIAEDLHQVYYLPEGDINMMIPLNEDDIVQQEELDQQQAMFIMQEDGKKVNILTQQIKYEVENYKIKACKKNIALKWISQLIFFMNQSLIIFGFVLEFQNSVPTDSEICKSASMVFMFIFLVISVYQYIDLYVIMILLIICLPFIIIFMIYQCIKQCQQKRKSNNFLTKLLQTQVEYSPGKVEGDPECHICLQTYNLCEKVMTLPCNHLHHFHSNCIRAWLKMTPNCPICRTNFLENDDPIRQPLNDLNQDL